jgi:ABC-type phosphate/phosphonate transport system ATPase subunit
MDQYITEETLQAFNINLEGQDKETLLEHLNDTLQERVGTEIAAMLDDDKLQELLETQKTATDEQMGTWLTQNVLELQQIVQDEINILMGELNENSDAINSAV